MPTECNPHLFDFARVEGRAATASFDGGAISSDAGALLLGAADRVLGLTLIDSTGLQGYGAGQWLEARHGAKSRRTWRKLHLAVDAANGMIVAQTPRDRDVDDPSQVGPAAGSD